MSPPPHLIIGTNSTVAKSNPTAVERQQAIVATMSTGNDNSIEVDPEFVHGDWSIPILDEMAAPEQLSTRVCDPCIALVKIGRGYVKPLILLIEERRNVVSPKHKFLSIPADLSAAGDLKRPACSRCVGSGVECIYRSVKKRPGESHILEAKMQESYCHGYTCETSQLIPCTHLGPPKGSHRKRATGLVKRREKSVDNDHHPLLLDESIDIDWARI